MIISLIRLSTTAQVDIWSICSIRTPVQHQRQPHFDHTSDTSYQKRGSSPHSASHQRIIPYGSSALEAIAGSSSFIKMLLPVLLSFPAILLLSIIVTSTVGASDDVRSKSLDLLEEQLQSVHPLWLRERCRSPFYTDPETRQPKYNLHEEVEGLTITSIDIDAVNTGIEEVVTVVFSDEQSCTYPTDILKSELNNQVTFLQALTWDFPPLFFWDRKSLLTPPVFDHYEISPATSTSTTPISDDYSDQSRKFLSVLISTGIALVENVPRQEGQCVRFAEQFSSLRETEWGKQFNVRSTPDIASGGVSRKDLAYTPFSIGMHVDSPYRVDTPPAFQLLHAIDHCSATSPKGCQVHNHFVDGFFVARALCEINREYFDSLTRTVLRWENNGGDDSSILYRYAPMIELQEGSSSSSTSSTTVPSCTQVQLKSINFSAKSGGYAPNLPHDPKAMNTFYEAKRMFSAMLHDEEYTVRVQLYPGALVIFDNRRILHSRSAIAPTDGERWLQGCYLNRDGILYLYERLRRKRAGMTETPFRTLKRAKKKDFDRMGIEYDQAIVQKTLDNLLELLSNQKEAYLGAPVSLMEHNIQTASRALRAGEDDETVVMSLFHDVFETLAVKNHGELAGAMLAPWISPKSQWLLAHHEIFQGYYYFGYYEGLNVNQRDMFQDNEYYNWTVTWCELYDQASFDPDYPSLPLDALLPVVKRVLARPQYWWNPSHPKAGAVSAKADQASNPTPCSVSGDWPLTRVGDWPGSTQLPLAKRSGRVKILGRATEMLFRS